MPDRPSCESCDDTGIYTEGVEWAPCDECFRGQEFAKLLKAHAKEIRAKAVEGKDAEIERLETRVQELSADVRDAAYVAGGERDWGQRMLEEREEARAGESRFAEERDCAFALLRWLLPVVAVRPVGDHWENADA